MAKYSDVEYNKSTLIKRVFLFVFLILLIIYGIYFYFESSNSNGIITSNSGVEVYERNSNGDFKSLNEDIRVEGKIRINREETSTTLLLSNFRITNQGELVTYLSTQPNNSELSKIAQLQSTIGSPTFKISNKYDLNEYQYFLIKDEETNTIIAYAKLS